MDITERDARLAELTRRVRSGEYASDPGLVADEILKKMRMIRSARAHLAESSAARVEALPQRHETGMPTRFAA